MFSEYNADQILALLGYGIADQTLSNAQVQLLRANLTRNPSPYPIWLSERVVDILETDLPKIETQKAEVMELAYVQASGSIQLTPASAIKMLNQQGSNLIQELSTLLGIPVRWNKYSSSNPSSVSTSYW